MARNRSKSVKQRKEERQQEKRRGQQVYIIGGVAIIVIFAAIVFALTSLPAEAPLPDDLDEFDRFITGTTDEGYPRLGNPDAPVTVREFSSFSCPGCMDFHRTTFPGLLDDIEAGRISFVYVPLQTGSVPNAVGAARTAICAGEQGKFWQMHEVLFSWHETFVNSAFQDGRIRTGVQELGLNVSEFNRCFNSNTTSAILSSAQGEGVTSTPSVEVNGVLVSANLTAIEEAISQSPMPSNLEPGVIMDESSDSADDEAVDEAVDETEVEATEEVDTEAESTEEASDNGDSSEDDVEAEATEETDE